jgi:hypothetical protein
VAAINFFAFYGGGGLVAGFVVASALSRRGPRPTLVGLLGVLGFAIWTGVWIWWGSQPCGADCVRDPTSALVAGFLQLGGWCAGAYLAFAVVAARRALARRRQAG